MVGTWNQAGTPPPEDLRAWLVPGCDLYSIGTQEVCQRGLAGLSKRLMPRAPQAEIDTAAWLALVQKALGPGFTVVATHSRELAHRKAQRRTVGTVG